MSIRLILTAIIVFLFNMPNYGQLNQGKPIGEQTTSPEALRAAALKAKVTAWGGTGRAIFKDVCTDKNNNIYACGYLYESTRFDDTLLSKRGKGDGFFIKYNSSGKILWLKQLPGFTNGMPGYIPSKTVSVNKVRTDNDGNVYILGSFQKQLTLPNANYLSNGGGDLFLIKYDTAGNFIWCRTSNCPHISATTFPTAMGISSNGDVVIAGHFYNTITIGATSLNATGNYDIFIGVFSSTGTFKSLIKADGAGTEQVSDLAIDSKDNVYITGGFNGGNFIFGNLVIKDSDPTQNILYRDFFLAKYSLSEKSWVWAVSEGVSNGYEIGNSLCVDTEDNIYVTGFCNGFDKIPYSIYKKAFLIKYGGDKLKIWQKNLSSQDNTTLNSVGTGIACDAKNNISLTGYFLGNLELEKGKALNNPLRTGEQSDIFVVKYRGTGQLLNYQSFGATMSDFGLGIKSANNGDLYLITENGFNLKFKDPILYSNLPLETPTVIKLTGF